MYSEELEWQARLHSAGSIMYLPDAVIMHHEGKSSEQHLARRHINFNRSKLRYARLRWGWPVAYLLRVFLLLTYVVQVLIEASKWLLGHKRPLRQQRIVQYGAILRSGL
jgi:GT2 family glycosyltransferase